MKTFKGEIILSCLLIGISMIICISIIKEEISDGIEIKHRYGYYHRIPDEGNGSYEFRDTLLGYQGRIRIEHSGYLKDTSY